MKKKIALVICILILITIFTACESTDEKNDENYYTRFTVIEYNSNIDFVSGVNEFRLMYDNETYIVYIFIDGYKTGGLSPYYIIGEDGCAHVAKYEAGQIIPIPNP